MSIASNVFLGREPRTRTGLVDWSRMSAEARELLAGYGIHDDVRRPLHTLGVGAQQMVALARAVSTDAKVVIMDEPTSSLEPREVETLFDVLGRLHAKGISVIYVSHRLDELYRMCDSVTVLRDGRVVHSGPLADLPRIQLVSLMLGREVRQIREEGVTAFGEEHEVQREPLLRAENLSGMRKLHDVSVSIRPGEVVGLAGLLGSGRSETARAIVGAFPLDGGTVLLAGKPVKRGRIAAAVRAGIALLAEDRKTDGIIPNLSVRENIVLAALPRLSPFGFVRKSQQDKIVRIFMERLRIKAAGPEQKVAELSGGNQQKVLLALARHRAEGTAARRADARHRRRREGRGAGADRRAGPRRSRCAADLLGAGGAHRRRRPGGRAARRLGRRGAERCRHHRGQHPRRHRRGG
jgi:ribose transport system ATP-binding protein